MTDYKGEARYDRAMLGLRKALGLTDEHAIELAQGGGVWLSGPGIGERIPLEGWADGYRMTFQWLLDFYGWAMQADTYTDSGGVKGVLLVDELEQHLHPSMQAGLMPSLKEILPDIQVFATTHSPLVRLGQRMRTSWRCIATVTRSFRGKSRVSPVTRHRTSSSRRPCLAPIPTPSRPKRSLRSSVVSRRFRRPRGPKSSARASGSSPVSSDLRTNHG
ncbi:MAG: ATP-binding protein [Candidatus Competibacteraceae bacterium]|nr:ATP-binding protein [Candidatus Competibacteraceae bacterium]